MSRAYNARRKARRQSQAAERTHPSRSTSSRRRLTIFVPVFLVVAIFAVVGALGFGTSTGVSKEQVEQEVTELLDGIPQEGAVLGSPKAPITVWVYADLECPTVKLFVENHLPSFVESWVRTGAVRVGYRSLQTDTVNEQVFFKQEVAALAAGQQGRMWNFLLTFVREQGEVRTDYATEEFFNGIASQAPGLKLPQWERDRSNALLSKQVALDIQSAHAHGFISTPSFVVNYTQRMGDRPDDALDWAAMKREVKSSLERSIAGLREETRDDFPTLKVPEQG